MSISSNIVWRSWAFRLLLSMGATGLILGALNSFFPTIYGGWFYLLEMIPVAIAIGLGIDTARVNFGRTMAVIPLVSGLAAVYVYAFQQLQFYLFGFPRPPIPFVISLALFAPLAIVVALIGR